MTKKKLIRITDDLFNDITEEDLLQFKGGKLFYKGKPLSFEQRKAIIAQAKEIKKTDLWKLLTDEMTYLGNKKIYFESKTEIDILSGKMVLWTMDVLKKKVDNLANLD